MEFTTYITADNKMAFKDGQLQELANLAYKWVLAYDDSIQDVQFLTATFMFSQGIDVTIRRAYSKDLPMRTEITIIDGPETLYGSAITIEQSIAYIHKHLDTTPMTPDQFNYKWKDHLETGHYGMSIELPAVIEYMDKEFTKEKMTNPTFTYSQIKMKFGMARVYTTSDKSSEWERGIDNIFKQREA